MACSSHYSPPSKRPKFDDDDHLRSGVHVVSTHIDLPMELLEQIFTTLPIYSLSQCRFVCKFWNSIISDPKFLQWKKHYYCVKYGHPSILPATRTLFPDKFSQNFLPALIKAVDNEFSSASEYLLYSNALKSFAPGQCDYLSKISSNLLDDAEKPLSYPAAVSLLLVFSGSVDHTICIIYTIISVTSNISYFIDFLYFVLFVFYKLWRRGLLPHRLHFNLCHALMTMESSSSKSDSFSLTDEQVQILQHDFRRNDIIKIEAFAGTGKTTTLAKLAEAKLSTTFLYMAFNRSMVIAANEIFSTPNVECRTFHSIAYNAVISHLLFPSSKLYPGSLEPYELYGFIRNNMTTTKTSVMAKWLLSSLNNYFASDSDNLVLSHVPLITEIVEDYFDNECQDLDDENRLKVFDLAKLVWAKMIDKEDSDVKLPHDGYLKLFQLNKLKLPGYDCLLIDEAQDITPAIKSIIDNQYNVIKIFVGDPHQGIYGFRGAVNALDEVRGNTSFYLTQSFRFGTKIAYLASCVLDVLKDVHKQTITGSMKPDGFSGIASGQVAFIGRTNAILFETAVEFCRTHQNEKIAFTTSSEKDFKKELNTLHDIYRLKMGQKDQIKSSVVRKYNNYQNMRESASFVLKRKIKLVEKYGDSFPDFLDILETTAIIGDWRTADYVFSTAHKSKGLQFDTVVVLEGFLPNYFTGLKFGREILVDEKNLLYVAITRARKQVYINIDILRLLVTANEHLMNIRTDCIIENTPPCVVCACDVKPYSYVYRSGINLNFPGLDSSNNQHHSFATEGPVCITCASKYMPYLKSVLSPNTPIIDEQ